MKIAVLGTGNIGGTLVRKWAAAGHEVTFGVRDAGAPHVRTLLADANGKVAVDTIPDAIASAEVVVFAIPGPAMESVIEQNGAALDGKIIIDATNKIRDEEMSSVPTFATRTPNAQVFRAFNTLGWKNFAEPQIGGEQADLFYCGPDVPHARQAVERLIGDVGLRPIRVGGLDQVHVLDGVLRLWFALAAGQKMGRHLAFKVLTPERE